MLNIMSDISLQARFMFLIDLHSIAGFVCVDISTRASAWKFGEREVESRVCIRTQRSVFSRRAWPLKDNLEDARVPSWELDMLDLSLVLLRSWASARSKDIPATAFALSVQSQPTQPVKNNLQTPCKMMTSGPGCLQARVQKSSAFSSRRPVASGRAQSYQRQGCTALIYYMPHFMHIGGNAFYHSPDPKQMIIPPWSCSMQQSSEQC